MEIMAKFTDRSRGQEIGYTAESLPFLFHLSSRVITTAIVGRLLASFLFKSRSIRVCGSFYGAGVGLGMSSSQLTALWQQSNGTYAGSDRKFYKDLETLESELKLS